MAREHETSVQPWGTLEELLLACAVNRHGTKSWDSIAVEVQNRTSSAFLLTPENCRHKFDDLKRRFMMSEKNNGDADDEESFSSAMVDHLKRIRVDELRREVRRRDVSIVSLELKVKRLEEERERSLKDKEDDLKRLDSQKKNKNLRGDDVVTEAGDGETSSENRDGGGRSKSGDDGSESCDRENRSFNESNSTSQKRSDLQRNGVVSGKSEPEPEPDRNKSDRAESERKATAAAGDGGNDVARGESSAKQSSEAQSSMSLTRRKRHRVGGGGGGGRGGESSSGEEPEEEEEEAEGDEVSPATKRLSAIKSEPFIKLLGSIRSHRLGSFFQRRLRSQESQRYKNLIRQHMDLQTVEARLEKGFYLDPSGHKFYRDLLLIFNNVVVFFRKGSQEHVAARVLRAQVLKEMKNTKKSGKSQTLTAKRELKREDDLVLPKSHNNVKKSPVMITCGKRGSGKPEVSKGKVDKKEKVVVEEEKPKSNEKKMNGSSFAAIDDKGIRKKRSQERPTRRGGSRTSNNGGGESEREFGGNELSSHDALEVKMDKKETVKKKQGAASFLKRMKQNSPKQAAEDDVSEEDSDQDSKVDREEERNKRNKGKLKKSSPVKERVTRSSTQGSKGTKEDSRKAKRGVGRPPKRPERVAVSNGKRGRDKVDQSEVGVAGGRPRKRSRR